MSKTLELELITPEKSVMKTAATFVVLPPSAGRWGFFRAMRRFWSSFSRARSGDGPRRRVSLWPCPGGFAEIQGGRVSLFAETAEMAESIDSERARQALEKAKAEATRKDMDPMTLMQAEAAVRRAQVRLKVSMIRRGGRAPGPTSGGGH